MIYSSKITKIRSAKNCTTHKSSERNILILIVTSCVQNKPFHGFPGIKDFMFNGQDTPSLLLAQNYIVS